MLYKYTFDSRPELNKLNKHLNIFFRRMRMVEKTADFNVDFYFHRDFALILRSSPELTKKFEAFFNAFKILSAPKKDKFYKMVLRSQSIHLFFEDTTLDAQQIHLTELRKILSPAPLTSLTKYLFNTTLKSPRWKIKDHYKNIYEGMPSHKACPFCGLAIMHKTFSEDYDHLAPKKHYPLTAINIRNLAPMCHACNTKFKRDIDILLNNGIRRPFAYPYTTSLDVDFDYSKSIIPETDLHKPEGEWKISVIPKSPMHVTWFEVFNIEERFVSDYIEPQFELWLDFFLDDIIREGVRFSTVNQVKNELSRYSKQYKRQRFVHANIIKAPLFEYLANCENQIFYWSLLRKYSDKILNQYAA